MELSIIRAAEVVQVEECLLSKRQALSSNPNAAKKKKKTKTNYSFLRKLSVVFNMTRPEHWQETSWVWENEAREIKRPRL
jgi:hypothetical protein